MRLATLLLLVLRATSDDSCWWGGATWEQCCHPSFGPGGNKGCWDAAYTYERCCGLAEDLGPPPMECVEMNTVLRHAGEHGLFTDVSIYSNEGCFMNNCKETDKFSASDWSLCARACSEVSACTHWTYGFQDESSKCFLRVSDGGREKGPGWKAGSKSCAPPGLHDAFLALAIAESEGLVACDGGKGDACPDVPAAINTWNLAIKYLRSAVEGRVDPGTLSQIEQIAGDSLALQAGLTAEYRPSDADFPRVVYNNRLIINSLRAWLDGHPKAELSPTDASLPKPLRTGKLCGPVSCY